MMDETLDKTALATITLLEARLLRIEYILFGPNELPELPPPASESAISQLAALERRFAALLSRVRVYEELLNIYHMHPTLFRSPPSAVASPSFSQTPVPSNKSTAQSRLPPTQLDPSAVRQTVFSHAAAFPHIASALTVATSEPIPEAAESARLIALGPQMRAIEALQAAQAAEIAELRVRSEAVLKKWYAESVLGYGQFIADTESGLERVERLIKRRERVVEKGVEAV